MHTRLIPAVAPRPTRPAQGGIEGAIKVSLGVTNRSKAVFVVVISQSPARVHCLIQVSPAVFIGIHQTGQFRSLHHINIPILGVNPEPQTFMQSISVKFPLPILSIELPQLPLTGTNQHRCPVQKRHASHSKGNSLWDIHGVHYITCGLNHRTSSRNDRP